jgi:glycosyltransferase involved in cell wall biosynthesis
MKDVKLKVIYIINRHPPYEDYANKPRPKYNWDTANGSWVGIWDYEWGDLIGKSLISCSDEIEFEVWQTDLRADRIYTAELDKRLIHKSFPATKKKRFRGLKTEDYVYSNEILEYAQDYNNENVKFIRGAVDCPFLEKLERKVNKTAIINIYLISTTTLLPDFVQSYNPVKLIHRYLINRAKHKVLKNIKYFLALNDNPAATEMLKNKFKHIQVFLFKIGMDLDYWRQDKSVEEARRSLNIPLDNFVIFLSQRLIPGYQIDKFIQSISKVKCERDFKCYISGHGTKEYERYLKELVKEHGVEGRIHFVGYVSEEELKNYFIACDVFATVPRITAGSNGAKKAMAINKPIVHITQGDTYEFLKENHAGLFLSPTDYDQWTKIFEEVIDGKKIKTVPREKVVDYFSWESTGKEILHAIENARK